MIGEQKELKEKIALLRMSYSKLRATCTPRNISQQTVLEYARKLRELEAQLN